MACSGVFAYSDSLLWQASSIHQEEFEDVNRGKYIEGQVAICAHGHMIIDNPTYPGGHFESLMRHTIKAQLVG